jgi:ABC-type multidrug transport system fused ATPase/permease subunit
LCGDAHSLPGLLPIGTVAARHLQTLKEGAAVIADIDFGDVLWTLLLLYLMVMYLVIVFTVIFDLFRDGSLGGGAKALWLIALIVFPFAAVVVYLIARGRGMAERSARRQAAEQQATDAYIRDVAGGGVATELEKAKGLLDSGAITQAEYDMLKSKLLA